MKPNPYSRQTFNRNAIMGQSFQPFIYLNTIYVYMWTTLNIVHTYNIFIKYGKDVQLSFTNWIRDRISGPQTNCQSKLYSAKPILQFNKQSWVNWNETLQKYNLHLKKNLSYTDFFFWHCLFVLFYFRWTGTKVVRVIKKKQQEAKCLERIWIHTWTKVTKRGHSCKMQEGHKGSSK